MTAPIITSPTADERSVPVEFPGGHCRRHPLAVPVAERELAERESYARAVRDQATYRWHGPSLRAMLDLAVDGSCEDMREKAKAWLDEQFDGLEHDGAA